jgi:hypothetical protein
MDLGPYSSTLSFNHEVAALVELPVTRPCLACGIRKKVLCRFLGAIFCQYSSIPVTIQRCHRPDALDSSSCNNCFDLKIDCPRDYDRRAPPSLRVSCARRICPLVEYFLNSSLIQGETSRPIIREILKAWIASLRLRPNRDSFLVIHAFRHTASAPSPIPDVAQLAVLLNAIREGVDLVQNIPPEIANFVSFAPAPISPPPSPTPSMPNSGSLPFPDDLLSVSDIVAGLDRYLATLGSASQSASHHSSPSVATYSLPYPYDLLPVSDIMFIVEQFFAHIPLSATESTTDLVAGGLITDTSPSSLNNSQSFS